MPLKSQLTLPTAAHISTAVSPLRQVYCSSDVKLNQIPSLVKVEGSVRMLKSNM